MELHLFDFIDETVALYEESLPFYTTVEQRLRQTFEHILDQEKLDIITLHSRIKEPSSVREKLLRNKFYLHFQSPQEALDHMHDLIGLTIECRFIRNEAEIYQSLFRHFQTAGQGMAAGKEDPSISLNLRMMQPQVQRNGFTIYRIDGQVATDEGPVNFELQIKALVHRFWSEIEHEVVYKNNEIVAHDSFMQQMLGSMRDSLDVVDHQMDILTQHIADNSSTSVGIDADSFKQMCASSINELVNRKMKESVGFASDFRKDAAILSQYIYIRYFLAGEHNDLRMVQFLEYLNELSQNPLDFRSEITLDRPCCSQDPLEQILLKYWCSCLNRDYEWHAFFTVLFAIQSASAAENLEEFASVIRRLLIQPGWYAQLFPSFAREDADQARIYFEETLGEAIVEADTIETIHDEKLYEMMILFRKEMERVSSSFSSGGDLLARQEELGIDLKRNLVRLFRG